MFCLHTTTRALPVDALHLRFLEPGVFSSPVGQRSVLTLVPDMEAVRKAYEAGTLDNGAGFPFWAKAWPAAIGLCEYLSGHSSLLAGKSVVEIGGGLGLPSLVAALDAASVYCTDLDPLALEFVEASARLNGFNNVQTGVVDWNRVPDGLVADVLLLSDLNYSYDSFDPLAKLIQRFLIKGSLVLLSTPQRLAGKDFLLSLLPQVSHAEEFELNTDTGFSMVTVYTLSP